MYLNLIGPDGSGKNTQEELLLPYFPNAIATREPGGTPEAEVIRDIILNKEYNDEQRFFQALLLLQSKSHIINDQTKLLLAKAITELNKESINGKAEMYLYAASRSESIEKVIIPAIKSKNNIIGNRSVACSIAYQGKARNLGMEKVWEVNKPIVEKAYPNLEIFIDIPTEVTMERLQNRSDKQDRLDNETFEFHKNTRDGYLHYYKNICPYPYEIVDGTGTVEDVHEQILLVLKEKNII